MAKLKGAIKVWRGEGGLLGASEQQLRKVS